MFHHKVQMVIKSSEIDSAIDIDPAIDWKYQSRAIKDLPFVCPSVEFILSSGDHDAGAGEKRNLLSYI